MGLDPADWEMPAAAAGGAGVGVMQGYMTVALISWVASEAAGRGSSTFGRQSGGAGRCTGTRETRFRSSCIGCPRFWLEVG
jgi:hypothetical protein